MGRDPAYRHQLERRYDGPIPPAEIEAAEWGLASACALDRALGQRLMWGSEVRRHIRRIRETRRLAGTEYHLAALDRELVALFLHFRSANRTCWRLERKGR